MKCCRRYAFASAASAAFSVRAVKPGPQQTGSSWKLPVIIPLRPYHRLLCGQVRDADQVGDGERAGETHDHAHLTVRCSDGEDMAEIGADAGGHGDKDRLTDLLAAQKWAAVSGSPGEINE